MLTDTYFFVLIVLVPIGTSMTTNSIDWCEYWARVGRQIAFQNEHLKADRPECAGYELPSGIKRADTFMCSKSEVYSCLDCEPTCNNLVPKCRKEQCNKGCVCKTGLARNVEGKCVKMRDCASHAPPKNDSVKGEEEEGTVMKTVKKMVPVIVNDVWKALFNSMRAPDVKLPQKPKTNVTPVLKPVDFTTPPPTEIKDEKVGQKGFYIDLQ